MLIKLDHITYSISKLEYPIIHKKLESKGYQIKFSEINFKNPINKMELMIEFQEFSDMVYYEKKGFISIEVIIYKKIHMDMNTIEEIFEQNHCEFFVNDFKTMSEMLSIIGGKINNEREINIKNLIDKSIYVIKFNELSLKRTWLCDFNGTGCLTFLVNSCENMKNKLEDNNYICTEINEIKIGENKINIFFVSNEYGDFIEVISMVKKEKKDV